MARASCWWSRALVLEVLCACGPRPAEQPGTTTGVGTSSTGNVAETTSVTDAESSAGSSRTETSTDATSSGGTTSSTATSAGESTTDACALPSCDFGSDCSDGVDNDVDGLVDLDDPECLSPCDRDEGSFCVCPIGDATDIADCNMDCAYDDDWGAGKEGCHLRLECDPFEPALYAGCDYDAAPQCVEPPVVQPDCLELCAPRTPNGCDCWGCCTFATADGPRNFFIEDPDCRLADGLAGCHECTQHLELCGNPCELDACEQCIGTDGPPPGCDAVGCADRPACTTHCDCAADEFCLLGCCSSTVPQ